MPWRGPRYPGELPTLGLTVLGWMTAHLAAPDRPAYEPFRPTREQAQFLLNFYAVDPRTGRRRYRRAVYSRSKGAGKSPFLAAIAAVEALGPVVPDGWDSQGEPVAVPWSEIRTPWVQLVAVSEDQTRNSYGPLLEMLREGSAIDDYPGLEPMNSFVNLPGKGRIEFVTSASTSREGNRPVFCALDQTETWVSSNGGLKLAATLRRNLGKTGGTSIESPNAYEPGAGSVAEDSAEFWRAIREGRAVDDGLLYDHREAPPETDLVERASLLAGLTIAYGESAAGAGGWVDLERIMAEIWDPSTHPADSRRYYLNQVVAASDAWISQPEWAGRTDATKVVADREAITLGFDGSRSRVRGVTDATALVGCRVSDGHLFLIGLWEQPEGPAGAGWAVPTAEVDAAVTQTFARHTVVGFYADPSKWETSVAAWEARYHRQLKVKATVNHPCEYWMTSGRSVIVARALEQFHTAVVDGHLTHDGAWGLTRHILNARRRSGRSGIQIAKEHPDSSRKIDAAVAAVLAFEARVAALGAGVGAQAAFVPRRIR